MKKQTRHWLERPLPILALMFANVLAKIDNYKEPYGLTTEWIARVKLICETFLEAYEKMVQNRATNKQLSDWFDELWTSKTKGEPVPAAPVFQAVDLPVGAFGGLKESFREEIQFFKALKPYKRADGEDLMIVSEEGDEVDFSALVADLDVSVDVDMNVVIDYKIGDTDGLEAQYREAGQTMWQLGDKSNMTPVKFKPVTSTPDQPVKLEVRGVHIVKNKRVGQWSPTHNLTYG
jgi:isopentenyldiphosphate isomerase